MGRVATDPAAKIETRTRSGPAPNPPRDGDCRQARRRINVEVRTGRRPHPNTIACTDCGHVWAEGERRHEYDHHLGYAAEHHYDVQSVCTSCHAVRGYARGERPRCGFPANIVHLKPRPGAMNPAAKLTEADVATIRARAARGEFQRAIATSYGMSQAQIGNIVRGSCWKESHGG